MRTERSGCPDCGSLFRSAGPMDIEELRADLTPEVFAILDQDQDTYRAVVCCNRTCGWLGYVRRVPEP